MLVLPLDGITVTTSNSNVAAANPSYILTSSGTTIVEDDFESSFKLQSPFVYRYLAVNETGSNLTNTSVHNNIIYGKFVGEIKVGTASRPRFVTLVDPDIVEFTNHNISDDFDGFEITFEEVGNIVSNFRGAIEIK